MSGGRPPRFAAPAPLTGALGTVSLADVLQLLELGRKSGVLAVDAGDGRRGLVRLADGAVAGARFRDVRSRPGRETRNVVDAVGELLALAAGRFAFTAAGSGSGDAPRMRVEAVLMAAVHRADERARAACETPPSSEPELAPGPAIPRAPIPILSAARPADGLFGAVGAPPLRAAHWAVLAAVDGARDVDAIAAEGCDADPAAVRQTLQELAAAGLVAFRDSATAARATGVPPAATRSSAF